MDYYNALIPLYQRAIEIAYRNGCIYRHGRNRLVDTVHWKAGNTLLKLGWFEWNGFAYTLTPEGRAAYEAAQPADGSQ